MQLINAVALNKLVLTALVSAFLLVGCLGFGQQPKAAPTPAPTIAPTVEPTATPTPTAAPTPAPTATEEYTETDKVAILYASFQPPAIKVKAGTKVTWENQDGRIHSVRSKEGAPAAFNSFNIPARQTYGYTFETAGRHEYYDEIGGGGSGVVLVE